MCFQHNWKDIKKISEVTQEQSQKQCKNVESQKMLMRSLDVRLRVGRESYNLVRQKLFVVKETAEQKMSGTAQQEKMMNKSILTGSG